MADSVLHVVGYHHCGEIVFLDDAVGKLENLCSRSRVESRRVLVKKQKLRLLHRCHEQSQSLTLTAREETDLCRQSVLKAEAEGAQKLAVLLALGVCNAPAEGAALASAQSQRKVFLDLHVGRGAHHGVLEHAADVGGSLVLGLTGDIDAVDDDRAGVDRPDACNGV